MGLLAWGTIEPMHESSWQTKLYAINKWLGSGSINIFGPPFAGKDTQAKHIAELLHASVVSGGDILRSHADQLTIKKLMSTGELFPTDYYLGIVLPYLSRPGFENKPLILSSVGRWSGEETVVMDAARKAKHPIKAVVYLNLEADVVHDRFEALQHNNDRGQRHDDALHLIDVRLAEFNQKTLPVIETYKHAGLLVEVDGNQSPDKVSEDIINSLFTKATGQI